MLSQIQSPEDLKKIPRNKLPLLAEEIRKKIIEVVGRNGGHLASNLGVVELTIALHRVFNSPDDAIIFDVSHQCYAHKIFTGRYNQFDTLRQHGGISGFTRRVESPHDFFDNGHSSTSISQGIGLLAAWQNTGKDGKVVAVIGDGALTGGMALEAMNHAGQLGKNLIVVLNDNKMSISENTGSISNYLSKLSMSLFYQHFRNKLNYLVGKLPNSDRHLGKVIYRFKRALKGLLLSNNLFSDLGFEYVGPLDGHNIREMEKVFMQAKKLTGPVVIHVMTKKGKGYSPAENDPATFHGIGPFLISDGKVEKFDNLSFTQIFSQTMVKLASENKKIAAITAAMAKGTGLDAFARKYPERFYDVGIAEEHAVSFAAGLAAGGMTPVVAIYSTFIQRAVDQIIHDIAISHFGAVICLDRSGAVPNDGETHQGIFDIALLRPVPNLTILSPATARDLELSLTWAVNACKPVVIRYPKSTCPSELEPFSAPVEEGKGIFVNSEDFAPSLSVQFDRNLETEDEKAKSSRKVLFACTGGILAETLQACRSLLMEGVKADIYSIRFIKPFDFEYFYNIAKEYDAVIFAEDGVKEGGISLSAGDYLLKNSYNNFEICAFPQKFLAQGSRTQILEDCKMDSRSLAEKAMALLYKK